jgi:hypothetical protein
MRYYVMYEGTYEDGWKNVDARGIPIIPYQFTANNSGLPIPPATEEPPPINCTIAQLEARINRLNDEDAARNLMHAHGYLLD